MMIFLLFLCFSLIGHVSAQTSEACPTYDASKIKMVTFDCFAALMAWEDSMMKNIAEIMPELSDSEVSDLMYAWEYAYGKAADTIFDEGLTGQFPFSWHISTQLNAIAPGLNLDISRSQFDLLVKSWGNLTPWPNTQETLEILQNANITIAALSNGDHKTLRSAMQIFKLPVVFTHVFPSDFPVGAFKPQKDIYLQALNVGYTQEEILHVAGGSTDASGARAAGFFSALLHKESTDSPEPCFVLDDISGVPAILGL
mmetsp:Transcript_8545/g.14169  ORF Transcript_8545/g.14169 Transcript_8545/m.14169 type:complete len:256 (+) Transcript_8545:35-802(+)